MRKCPTYKGKLVTPSEMTISSLRAYTRYAEEFLEWCCCEDGRTVAYDAMAKNSSPYFDELEKRDAELKKGKK